MPKPQTPRTPDQRRAYRARCISENRCANCAAPRAEGDTATLLCPKCRQRKNNGSNAAYAAARAQNPPDFSRSTGPETPFRYGKTRLNAPRRITITLDLPTYEAIQYVRRNYCTSPAYQPYQVSEVIRRLLSLLPTPPQTPPLSEGQPAFDVSASNGHPDVGFNPRPSPPRPYPAPFQTSGLTLCFMCDAPNVARIKYYQTLHQTTLAHAVRACIKRASQIALSLPNETAKTLLWPGYADLAPPE